MATTLLVAPDISRPELSSECAQLLIVEAGYPRIESHEAQILAREVEMGAQPRDVFIAALIVLDPDSEYLRNSI